LPLAGSRASTSRQMRAPSARASSWPVTATGPSTVTAAPSRATATPGATRKVALPARRSAGSMTMSVARGRGARSPRGSGVPPAGPASAATTISARRGPTTW
jgi:hypothetical protein